MVGNTEDKKYVENIIMAGFYIALRDPGGG